MGEVSGTDLVDAFKNSWLQIEEGLILCCASVLLAASQTSQNVDCMIWLELSFQFIGTGFYSD